MKSTADLAADSVGRRTFRASKENAARLIAQIRGEIEARQGEIVTAGAERGSEDGARASRALQ